MTIRNSDSNSKIRIAEKGKSLTWVGVIRLFLTVVRATSVVGGLRALLLVLMVGRMLVLVPVRVLTRRKWVDERARVARLLVKIAR